jgi:hypothetical protein
MFLPVFLILLIVFWITVCCRKVEDPFLSRAIKFMIAAILLEMIGSVAMLITYDRAERENMDYNLMLGKTTIVGFVIPYYFFENVMIALLFSFNNFIQTIKGLLFSKQKAEIEGRLGSHNEEKDGVVYICKVKDTTLFRIYLLVMMCFIITVGILTS